MMSHSLNIFFFVFLVTEGLPVHNPATTSKLLSKSSVKNESESNVIFQNEHKTKDDTNELIEDVEKFLIKDSGSSSTVKSTNSSGRNGICLREDLCSVSGSISILSGISWMPELLQHHSKEYLDLELELKFALKNVFFASHLRSGFVESIIEAVSKQDEVILVDFSLVFEGLRYDIDTEEIENIVKDNFDIIEDKSFLGKFNIDEERINFLVIENNMKMIPKWAWGLSALFSVSILFSIFLCIGVKIKKQRYKTRSKRSSELEMIQTIQSLQKRLEEKQTKESQLLCEIIHSFKTKTGTNKEAETALSTFVKNYNVYNKMYSEVDMWSVQRMAEKIPSLVINLPVPNLPVRSCCPFCKQG